MRPHLPVVIVLACLVPLVPAPAAGAASAPAPPEDVVAVEADGRVVVAWSPAPGLAPGARYHVYGGAEGALVLLGSTQGGETLYAGPGGYANYAVATVVDGAESELAFRCVWVDWHVVPPSVVFEPNCDAQLPSAARVLLPVVPPTP